MEVEEKLQVNNDAALNARAKPLVKIKAPTGHMRTARVFFVGIF